MNKQDKKFIELFQAILEENDYYDFLGKLYKKRGKELASELYFAFEDLQPISVYGFLDNIEDTWVNNRKLKLHEVIDKIDYWND